MKNQIALAVAWVVLGGVLLAQPYIPPGSVTNDASNAPSKLPAGTIAPGSRFAVRGSGLGPTAAASLDSYPAGTTLAGVAVVAVSGGVTYNCYPFYVSDTLVEAVLPSTVPVGGAVIRVTYASQTSNSGAVTVAAHSPGLYSVNVKGEGPGQISDYASAAGKLISSTTAPGRRLTTASILATGLGASAQPDNQVPPQQNLPYTVSVLVGGQTATRLIFAGRSNKHPGADQIIFQVPVTALLGCYVPVQILVNGVPSNLVTVALSATAAACADPGNPVSSAIGRAGNVVLGALQRTDMLIQGNHLIADLAATGAWQMTANSFAFERSISLPPAGSCTAYMSRGDVTRATLSVHLSDTLIDGGTLNISGPNGGKTVASNSIAFLGVQGVIVSPNPGLPYLSPGPYTLSSTGGAAVGSYSVSPTLDAPVIWTNQASIQSVNRSLGVTLQWSGAGSRQVLISGAAALADGSASAQFICVAAAGTTSFTVPASVLQLLPAVPVNGVPISGQLSLGAFASGTPAVFSATGINFGAMVIQVMTGQPVLYQ
jgi:uncharacterized protein (TIGR03437 family)